MVARCDLQILGTDSIDWAQLSSFYLRTETKSSVRNEVLCKINRNLFLDKDRTVDSTKNVILVFIQMYHRHKVSDRIYKFVFAQRS
jgi:hypothetical protein